MTTFELQGRAALWRFAGVLGVIGGVIVSAIELSTGGFPIAGAAILLLSAAAILQALLKRRAGG